VAELATEIFKLPVRVGSPLPVGGLVADYRNPAFATAVGLALEGADRDRKSGIVQPGEIREKGGPKFWEKLRDWLDTEFFATK
jgi:cell division protein FtsA